MPELSLKGIAERGKKKKEDEVRVNVAYYIMKAFDILLWTDIYRPPDASN